jgi:hypothetical protein
MQLWRFAIFSPGSACTCIYSPRSPFSTLAKLGDNVIDEEAQQIGKRDTEFERVLHFSSSYAWNVFECM